MPMNGNEWMNGNGLCIGYTYTQREIRNSHISALKLVYML